jgi:hypothetical protein
MFPLLDATCDNPLTSHTNDEDGRESSHHYFPGTCCENVDEERRTCVPTTSNTPKTFKIANHG